MQKLNFIKVSTASMSCGFNFLMMVNSYKAERQRHLRVKVGAWCKEENRRDQFSKAV